MNSFHSFTALGLSTALLMGGGAIYQATAIPSQQIRETESIRYTWETQLKIQDVLEQLKPYASESSSELMIRVAKIFLGTPYVAGTLEFEPEKLTVNVLETDCILFVEMCTAFVQTIQGETQSFGAFCRNLQAMRYVNGLVDGYASRQHYTSGWILQNEENGKMQEITANLPGARIKEQQFSFMTQNAHRYAQLKDETALKKIQMMEESLNQYTYYWLAPEDVAEGISGVQNGDIVCFVDKREGLDIAHVGIAYEHEGQMHFIHASYGGKAVIIESKTLAEYAKNGLRVCRLR